MQKYIFKSASGEKSVNHKNAPRFRVNFAGAKFQLGEAQDVLAYGRTEKADKSCKDFCLFLQLFLSKRKSRKKDCVFNK